MEENPVIEGTNLTHGQIPIDPETGVAFDVRGAGIYSCKLINVFAIYDFFSVNKSFLEMTRNQTKEVRAYLAHHLTKLLENYENEGSSLLSALNTGDVTLVLRTSSGRSVEIPGRKW